MAYFVVWTYAMSVLSAFEMRPSPMAICIPLMMLVGVIFPTTLYMACVRNEEYS